MGTRDVQHNRVHCRRGSIYVVVLGASLLVTVIGLSGLLVLRIQRRAAADETDLLAARLHARAAIQIGRLRASQDPNWRSNNPNGTWITDQSVGNGSFTLEGVDPVDGDLADAPSDPLVLTGIGKQGDARHKTQVTLNAELSALTCLEVAMHAESNVTFTQITVQCDQTISTNDSISATDSTIFSTLQAVNTITGSGTIWGGPRLSGMNPPRTMPDATTLFDLYAPPVGTQINIASLPSSGPGASLEDVLLSPQSNPYGSTNAQGIYVIDVAGTSLRIRNCRIVGTLVLLNTTTATEVIDAVHWEPAIANYPSLLVKGQISFHFDATRTLDEGSTNFNPQNTPYGGTWDTVTDDSYPTVIKGLVYVSGRIDTTTDPSFDGAVVCGDVANTTNDITLTYQSTFLNDPPPGFGGSPRMVVAPDSWKQQVD